MSITGNTSAGGSVARRSAVMLTQLASKGASVVEDICTDFPDGENLDLRKGKTAVKSVSFAVCLAESVKVEASIKEDNFFCTASSAVTCLNKIGSVEIRPIAGSDKDVCGWATHQFSIGQIQRKVLRTRKRFIKQ